MLGNLRGVELKDYLYWLEKQRNQGLMNYWEIRTSKEKFLTWHLKKRKGAWNGTELMYTKSHLTGSVDFSLSRGMWKIDNDLVGPTLGKGSWSTFTYALRSPTWKSQCLVPLGSSRAQAHIHAVRVRLPPITELRSIEKLIWYCLCLIDAYV